MSPSVSIFKRLNRSDRSYTMYLRWTDPATGREVRERAFRTGPYCGRIRLRDARRRARDLAAERQIELRRGPSAPPTIRRPIAEARAEYLLWCESPGAGGVRNAASGTIVNKTRHIDEFLGFAREQERPPQHISGVLRFHVARWRDKLIGRGLKPGTVNAMLASISAWLAWATDHGYMRGNPCAFILRCRLDNGKRAKLPIRTPDDLRRLCDKMPDRRRADVVLLLACTGLRIGELRDMTWECWNEEQATLRVPQGQRETTKRHGRTIPLCDQTAASLRRLRADGGRYIVGADGNRKPLTSQLNAWLQPFHVMPHDLRRFFITAMETVGAPKSVIDDLVGHSPGKVRAAYTPGENLEAARPWVRKFEEWLGR